jgi:hypothetical protein
VSSSLLLSSPFVLSAGGGADWVVADEPKGDAFVDAQINARVGDVSLRSPTKDWQLDEA